MKYDDDYDDEISDLRDELDDLKSGYDDVNSLRSEIEDLKAEIEDLRSEIENDDDDYYIPSYSYRKLTPEEIEKDKRNVILAIVIPIIIMAAIFIPIFIYVESGKAVFWFKLLF